MTSEYDQRSRTLDTKMQGFHQIVAVSQDLINTSLWSLWTDEEKEDEPAKFQVVLPDMSEIGMTGKMRPPTIELFQDASNDGHPPRLYFNLNFDSGKFDYYAGFGPDATKKTADIEKWKLVFRVNLSLDELANVPEDVQKNILFNSMYKTTVSIYREIAIQLSSVLEGGLEVHVTEDPPKVGVEGNKRYLFWDFDSGQVPGRMKKHVESRVVNESMAEGIKEALNGQQQFVFPGGGTFMMKDPSFNAEGDLLIGLNYKEGQL
jgi:hypothetical protein